MVRFQTPELFSYLTLQDSASTTRFRVKIATLSKVWAYLIAMTELELFNPSFMLDGSRTLTALNGTVEAIHIHEAGHPQLAPARQCSERAGE